MMDHQGSVQWRRCGCVSSTDTGLLHNRSCLGCPKEEETNEDPQVIERVFKLEIYSVDYTLV